MKKIAIIGNSCSGKTKLSRFLADKYNLPLIHVDSIQFLPGLLLRDPADTRRVLVDIADRDEWIIDGFGPLKIIEDRFSKADVVVFIRLPLWRSYYWCLLRQVKGLFVQRQELPEGCFEATFVQTRKLFKTIWNMHRGLWPQLDRIFLRELYINKVIYIRSVSELDRVCRVGLKNYKLTP